MDCVEGVSKLLFCPNQIQLKLGVLLRKPSKRIIFLNYLKLQFIFLLLEISPINFGLNKVFFQLFRPYYLIFKLNLKILHFLLIIILCTSNSFHLITVRVFKIRIHFLNLRYLTLHFDHLPLETRIFLKNHLVTNQMFVRHLPLQFVYFGLIVNFLLLHVFPVLRQLVLVAVSHVRRFFLVGVDLREFIVFEVNYISLELLYDNILVFEGFLKRRNCDFLSFDLLIEVIDCFLKLHAVHLLKF